MNFISIRKNCRIEIYNDYFNLKKKLYNILPKVINGKNINWNINTIKEFERFIKFAKVRNSIMHYSRKETIHDEKLINLVNDAENIIKLLFQKYISLGASIEMFNWLK